MFYEGTPQLETGPFRVVLEAPAAGCYGSGSGGFGGGAEAAGVGESIEFDVGDGKAWQIMLATS
jgi:hypothetical protein